MATLPATKQFTDRVNRIEISATMAVVAEAAKLKATAPIWWNSVRVSRISQRPSTSKTLPFPPFSGLHPLHGCSRHSGIARCHLHRHATDFGSDYKPEEAIASTGGKLALFNAIQVLVDHGDEVILPVPYWVSFKDIIEYGGGKCVYVPPRSQTIFV